MRGHFEPQTWAASLLLNFVNESELFSFSNLSRNITSLNQSFTGLKDIVSFIVTLLGVNLHLRRSEEVNCREQSSERVLDSESEVPGSILTRGNILLLEFFVLT